MNRSQPFGYSEHYESSKNALERETAALLAERRQLEGVSTSYQEHRAPIRPVFQESAAITPVALTKIQSENKTNDVVSKLQEIIQLCRQDGSLSNEEMREVVKVENEVLQYLQRTTNEEPSVKPPSPRPSHSQQPSQVYQAPPTQQYQPTHHIETSQVYQSTYPLSQPIQSPHSQHYPVSQPSQTLQQHQSGIKARTETTTNFGVTQGQQIKPILSDDTLEIISVIQRRALGEIISLQQQRDNLKRQRDLFAVELERIKHEFTHYVAPQPAAPAPPTLSKQSHREEQRFSRIDTGQIEKLKEQNRVLRQENHLLKEDNQYLNSRIENLNQTVQQQQRETLQLQHQRETYKTDNRSTYPENPKNNLIYGQFDSQITVYENELKRASVVINELRSRLANVPGLEELHDQGERIRRETTQLLQLKGGIQSQGAIRELQQRLESQERGKAAFLEELKAFKQKYLELQQENRALRKSKVSFDPVPRPPSNSPPKDYGQYSARGIIKKKGGLGDYEQTLNDMKNVLY